MGLCFGYMDSIGCLDELAGSRGSARRPVRGLVVAFVRQLPRLAAIRQHRPNLQCAGARRFENKMPPIRRPAGTLVSPGIPRKFNELSAYNVHYIDIEIPARP